MDVSYPAILIGTLSCGMLRLKAYMMAYDKQLRLYNDVRRESKFFRKEGMRIYLLMVIYKL
jgi:hypothetical protein